MSVKILTSEDPRVQCFIGKQINRLTAVRFIGVSKRGQIWEFICVCGNTTTLHKKDVVSGNTHSCGCWRKLANITHGQKANRNPTPAWRHWQEMLRRCNNKSSCSYAYYGGRGITVCERWKSFENFFEDMYPKPEGMTLERIDNDGPYSPENCKWATRKEQANNRRGSRMITYQGLTMNASQWAEKTGVLRATITSRLDRGCTIEKSLTP